MRRLFALSLTLLVSSSLRAADYPDPTDGDYVIRDFRFASGEVLPELRIHYRTLGAAAEGRARGSSATRS